MRDVGEQRAERDDHRGAELGREAGDELRERPPAQARLGSEEQHGIARLAVLRLVTRACWNEFSGQSIWRSTLDERDVRARHLEVEEELGVDLGELLGAPGAGEERGRERGALAAVVPAAEGADQDRAVELRPLLDPKLGIGPHQAILLGRHSVATKTTVAAQTTAESVTCRITRPNGRCVRYWISPTIICTTSSASTDEGVAEMAAPA